MERQELFFEDLFRNLIEESNNIVIEYDYKIQYYKDDSFATYEIKKINDVYPYKFKDKIQKLGKQGIELLKEELKNVVYEFRISFLESIKGNLLSLLNIIKDDKIIHEKSEDRFREEITFNSFANPTLKPFSEDRKNGHAKSILFKASDLADDWIEGIQAIADKINFLINQIELTLEPKNAVKDKNSITLFYSWQSDNEVEKKLIWKALRNIEEYYNSKGRSVNVESDMRGVSGSQDIPNTLFRKIDACDIFLTDINLVNSSLHREDSFSPNPNVLIELGYAAAKLNWDRVILLFNADIYKIEQLPFDIRQRVILWYKSEDLLIDKLKLFINEIIK